MMVSVLELFNILQIAVIPGIGVIVGLFKSSFISISSALENSQSIAYIRTLVDDFNYAIAGAVIVAIVIAVHEVELDVLLVSVKVKRKRRPLMTSIAWIFVPHYLSLWMRCVSQSSLWHQ